jgi:aminoglycoside phosphotransferase (APT) family kinase protein
MSRDARALAALTAMERYGAVGDDARVTAFAQLPGGWSRQSFVLDVADPTRGDRACIVRVRPPGTSLDTDIGQEGRTLELLQDVAVPTPEIYGMELGADNLFDGPFFVMERLPGVAPNVWNKADRAELTAAWEDGSSLAADFVENLAAIHGMTADHARSVVPPRSYQDSVDHWADVWARGRLVADPVVEEAFAWLRSREPDPIEPRLVHGDYRIGNCLVLDRRVSGILDWELSHVGDPRFDLGYLALEYAGGKFARPGSPLLGAVADREWFFARYTELTGIAVDVEVVDTYSVLGALMMIAIMSTGIRSYVERSTDDIRLAWSRFAIPGLRQDVVALMGW